MLNYVRLLNVVLLAVMAFLGYSVYTHWNTGGDIRADVTEVAERNVRKGQPATQAPIHGLLKGKLEHQFSFYQDIVDKNLFTADRKNIADEKSGSKDDDKAATKAAPVRFTLYGIAMSGDERIALIGFQSSDPVTKRRLEKTRTVKVGDKIEGNKITEIEETSLKMESGGESLLLNVYDAKDPGMRRQDRTAQAVRSISPPASAPGQASAPPQVSAQASPPAQAAAPQPQGAQSNEPRTSAFIRNRK